MKQKIQIFYEELMTIKSYLAFANQDHLVHFEESVKAINGCELHAADEKEVFILVTESSNDRDEERILKDISELAYLECLSLVGVWGENIE